MLTRSTVLKYYKRRDIQEALVRHAKNKEVGIFYGESFGKRPDTLSFPNDVIELAINRATSFHTSEEIWGNPLSLDNNPSQQEIKELRIGWDLVLDINCKIFEYSRICADLIAEFLKSYGINNIYAKFSGNKGFHLGISFDSFPAEISNQKTKDLFPEAARKIAAFIRESIKEELSSRIMKFEDGKLEKVREKVGLNNEDILRYEVEEGYKVTKLEVNKFLEIDTVLISHRHLYRMPYSLHEKSGLASLPIDPNKILQFEKNMAIPENVKVSEFGFLERVSDGGTARGLLIDSLDFKVKAPEIKEKKEDKEYDQIVFINKIGEEFFPPCIKLILLGLEDGKKRGLFCLANFLGKVGWTKKELEEYIQQWNEKNPTPLRPAYVKGQINHYKPGERLPPNCDNEAYFKGIGVCKPDSFCSRIKNPANYTILKWKEYNRNNKPKKERKKKADKNLKKDILKEEIPEKDLIDRSK